MLHVTLRQVRLPRHIVQIQRRRQWGTTLEHFVEATNRKSVGIQIDEIAFYYLTHAGLDETIAGTCRTHAGLHTNNFVCDGLYCGPSARQCGSRQFIHEDNDFAFGIQASRQ
jgi:hypothetical protein